MKAESRHGSLLQRDEILDSRNLISSKEVQTGHNKINIRIYRTWEIIPDEMHFGIIAWPSTILRPDKLWRSWGPALRVWSRCSTRDCLSWVVKNRISSSLPSKQLASEPTNSLNPPPNSCLRDFGRCTSSAALSRLQADRVTSMRLFLLARFFTIFIKVIKSCHKVYAIEIEYTLSLYLYSIGYLHAKWCRNVKPVTVRRGVMSHMNY